MSASTVVQRASPAGSAGRGGSPSLLAMLVTLLLLPSAIFSADLASSLALGTGVMAAGLLLMALLGTRRLDVVLWTARCAPWLVAAVLVHLWWVNASDPIDWERASSSLVLLVVVMAGSKVFAGMLERSTPDELQHAAKRSLALLLLIAMGGLFEGLQPFTSRFPKPLFPFAEPSHFALVLAPVLMFVCVTATLAHRAALIAAVAIQALLLQSLTLLVVCALVALACLRVRHLLPLLGLVAVALLASDASYYAERLDFSEGAQNLSSLVYLQGWQLVEESWEGTGGSGVGFQQLGLAGTRAAAAEVIRVFVNDDVNILDGGFTLAKLLGEFGYLGVAVLLAYLTAAIGAFGLLRRFAVANLWNPTLDVFCASCLVAYLVELLVRGAGYFTPSGLLLLSSLWLWLGRGRRRTASRAPLRTAPA
jgi:hypothetical protein